MHEGVVNHQVLGIGVRRLAHAQHGTVEPDQLTQQANNLCRESVDLHIFSSLVKLNESMGESLKHGSFKEFCSNRGAP